MTTDNLNQLVTNGLDALQRGDTLQGLVRFEQAYALARTPLVSSYYGYCLALEGQSLKLARACCRDAIRAEPANSLHYLHLGRVYLLAGKRRKAIRTFHLGLVHGPDPRIVLELKRLGIRRSPVFPALPRRHPINRIFGRLLHWAGLR